MKTHPAFPPVNCQYGAPMGRCPEDPNPADATNYTPAELRIHVKRAPFIDGAYDMGGAYWGSGAPIHAVWNRAGLRRYYRAWTATGALALYRAESAKP